MGIEEDFVRLKDVSQGDLLVELGEAIATGREYRAYRSAADGLGARAPRTDRMKALAQQWIKNNRALFEQAICQNTNIRTALSSDPGVTIESFKLIVDAFTAIKTTVPVATLTMLVLRKGLEWACPPS